MKANNIKQMTGYDLSETNCMIGAIAVVLNDYKHMEENAIYQRIKKLIEDSGDKIDAERDRREEAEEARHALRYFNHFNR